MNSKSQGYQTRPAQDQTSQHSNTDGVGAQESPPLAEMLLTVDAFSELRVSFLRWSPWWVAHAAKNGLTSMH